MIYIKKINAWYKTRKIVVELLKERGYHTNNYDEARVVLNFGSNHHDDRKIILNKDIDIMRDKIKMNGILDRAWVRHPKTFYYPFQDLPNMRNKCVIKNRYGQMGNHQIFTTFKKAKKLLLNSNQYIQEFIPFEREFRVLVDHFGCFRATEKIGESDLRNSKSCRFKDVYGGYDDLREMGVQVAKIFGVDFVGFDIGYCNNRYWVIELNSAPSLSTRNAIVLVNNMIELL